MKGKDKKNMDLIIVESPSKAKTIAKYLKGKYKVDASGGHVRDLPEKRLGVDIEKNFAYFWCMFDRSTGKNKLIGTIAVRDLGAGRCELKSVYLLEKYHGRGLGYMMLQTAVSKAREAGYSAMYLDTMSSSRKAIALYEKAGFIMTDRYNESPFTDVFMVMPI